VRASLKGADFVVVGFSYGSMASFASVRTRWIPLIRRLLLDVPVALVGLKYDLAEPKISPPDFENPENAPVHIE